MNVTSFWQSLELLQAKLDRETADFYYVDTPSGNKALHWRGEDVVFPLTAKEIPAWSMERLWEIVGKVARFYFEETDKPEYIIERLIDLYKEYGEN